VAGRWTLVVSAAAIIGLLIIVPVVNVFYEALAKGTARTGTTWSRPGHRECDPADVDRGTGRRGVEHRLRPGRGVAIAASGFAAVCAHLADRPAVRRLPGVAGLIIVLIFGLQGYWAWLREHNIKIIFATRAHSGDGVRHLPVRRRELIPLMEAVGAEEETAAVSLSARLADVPAHHAAERQVACSMA